MQPVSIEKLVFCFLPREDDVHVQLTSVSWVNSLVDIQRKSSVKTACHLARRGRKTTLIMPYNTAIQAYHGFASRFMVDYGFWYLETKLSYGYGKETVTKC